MKHTECEHQYPDGKEADRKEAGTYRGPLSPLEQLERIAANNDSEDLLIWGSAHGVKVWKWITVGELVLSVQGSSCHYCNPRLSHGPYTALEVAVPGGKERIPKHWEQYNTEPGDPYGPYAEVPVSEIRELIEEELLRKSPDQKPGSGAPPHQSDR